MRTDIIRNLKISESSVTLHHILENSKASSGGHRDCDFLTYLVDNSLLILKEGSLKRSLIGAGEEYYLERYKKAAGESDKHFLCRTMVQDELKKLGINTLSSVDMGDMSVLHMSSNYDIVTEDFSIIIDIGLTPARNYFRGLTDTRTSIYMITTYFDDYIDDIIFSCFEKASQNDLVNAVKDYMQDFRTEQYGLRVDTPKQPNVLQ